MMAGIYSLHKIPSCKKTYHRPGGTSAKTGFSCVRVVIMCDKESSVCCAAFNTVRSAIVSVKLAELGGLDAVVTWHQHLHVSYQDGDDQTVEGTASI